MTMHAAAEAVSLTLTWPCVAAGLYVCYLFWGVAKDFVRGESLKDTDWFALGVVIGFSGGSLDTVFWLIPWTLDFMGSGKMQASVLIGVYFNVPLRQIAGLAAAYCHARAHRNHYDNPSLLHRYLLASTILGICYTSYFYMLRTA